MSNTTPALDEHGQPVSKELLQWVFDSINNEREQIWALAVQILRMAQPDDPKNPEDTDNIALWRVAEVMTGMLECTESSNSIAKLLGLQGVNHG